MALVFEPLPDTELILGGSEETGLVFGVGATLILSQKLLPSWTRNMKLGCDLHHREP